MPIDDIINTLDKLPNDPYFNQISENAGLVGGGIKLTLYIIEKVSDKVISTEQKLSLMLNQIMLESASNSIPYSIFNLKIEDFFQNDDSSKFENIILELFKSEYNEMEPSVTYLPDHPIIQKFRALLEDGINKYNVKHKVHVNRQLFLTEFNTNLLIKLDKEQTSNIELSNLLNKWKVNSDFHNLQYFLKNAKGLFLTPNPIDNKPLSDYYIENDKYIVKKDTWDYNEKDIKIKEEWKLSSFLNSNRSLEVIAAPFGIGKSSLAKKIAYDCSTQFIKDPTDPGVYIPIFVSLKYALETTCNNNSLDVDLGQITSYSSRGKKDTKILIILDGLDELPNDRPINIHNIYTTIQVFLKEFPKIKFIITTRLESGFPTKLNIKDNYVRLFSFEKAQIFNFFKIYGLSNHYNKIIRVLSEQKIGKPLFCWMIATVYKKSSTEEVELLFNSNKDYLAELFLYQQFIHNVIFGKPKDVAKDEYDEWYRKSKDEKKSITTYRILKKPKFFIVKD